MSIPNQDPIQNLMRNPRIKECMCDPYNRCIEAGKISWDNRVDTFVHVRFDGCICRDLPVSRCDCVIFRVRLGNQKSVMFVIEVKECNPDLTEVREKIQYCIDEMIELLPHPRNQFRIIPVLCASAFHGLNHRAFFNYRVKIFGGKTVIRKRLHHEDINSL